MAFEMWIVLTFLTFLNLSKGQGLFSISLDRVECNETTPSLVYNYSCFTKLKSRTKRLHNIILNLQPNVLLSDIHLHIQAYYKFGTTYKPMILTADEDVCAFLKGTKRGKLIPIVWPSLAPKSNLNHTCPFTGHNEIIDFEMVDMNRLPPVIPAGEAKIVIHIKEGPERNSILKVTFFCTIKPIGSSDLALG